jgi:hypothetical protein
MGTGLGGWLDSSAVSRRTSAPVTIHILIHTLSRHHQTTTKPVPRLPLGAGRLLLPQARLGGPQDLPRPVQAHRGLERRAPGLPQVRAWSGGRVLVWFIYFFMEGGASLSLYIYMCVCVCGQGEGERGMGGLSLTTTKHHTHHQPESGCGACPSPTPPWACPPNSCTGRTTPPPAMSSFISCGPPRSTCSASRLVGRVCVCIRGCVLGCEGCVSVVCVGVCVCGCWCV